MIKRVERNLLKIFDRLNSKYFDSTVQGGIGWRNYRINKHTQCLGEAYFDERFIKINVILQDSRVPVWYLKYVVYHEMLHLHQGWKEDPHDEEFCRVESQYPDFQRALEFETFKLPKIAKDWRKAKKRVDSTARKSKMEERNEPFIYGEEKEEKKPISCQLPLSLFERLERVRKQDNVKMNKTQFIITSIEDLLNKLDNESEEYHE